MGGEFRVRFPPPLDVRSSLQLFQRSGDDLIDRWDGQRLVRAVAVDGTWVPFLAVLDGATHAPSMRLVIPSDDRAHHAALREVTESAFVPAPEAAYADLLARDGVLATLDARFPGIRQIRQLDLFTALVRCISAQQVNLRWAVTTRRRLAEAFGQRHEIAGHTVCSLDPQVIARVNPADIRALQFTTSKAISIVATAQALSDPRLSLAALRSLPDEEVIAHLVAIRGIGRWSAEWVLARALGRPTVVAGDLAVRKAVGLAYRVTPVPSEAEVRQLTAHWGAAAGTAQALLLHALAEGALGVMPREIKTRKLGMLSSTACIAGGPRR